MRLFSGLLKYVHGITLQIADAVKIKLGGLPILMPQYSLDGSERHIVAVHN